MSETQARGKPRAFSFQLGFDNQKGIAHRLLVAAIAATPAGGFPVVRSESYTVKTKTVTAATLAEFASLLEAKRTTAAAAAAAAKAAKVAAEALGLPAESVLLKADDRSTEVAAIYTVRPVAAIAEREDRFHSFKVVKG
jgi:hypothetical protein